MAEILLIDDDREVLEINRKYLTGEGFTVYTADSPRKGIAYAKKLSPDCILLDVMLPEMDGYEVCRRIRSFSAVPVLFLTGRGTEDDKIDGLTSGGDDYIVKPYSLRELKARIDVILRRMNQLHAASESHILTFGSLSIDKVAHKAFFQGTDLNLANREYEVLLYLAEHPDREVTFESLAQPFSVPIRKMTGVPSW